MEVAGKLRIGGTEGHDLHSVVLDASSKLAYANFTFSRNLPNLRPVHR